MQEDGFVDVSSLLSEVCTRHCSRPDGNIPLVRNGLGDHCSVDFENRIKFTGAITAGYVL